MPRPVWKGKPILNSIFLASIKELDSPIKLYRRNVFLTKSSIPFLENTELRVYNGYDFFDKVIDENLTDINISSTVLTREINVKHKAKLSKHAKKNLQLKSNKKRLASTSLTKKTIKKKTTRKK